MKNIVVKGWMVAVVTFVVLFGGIYLTIGTGHWSTTRKKGPVRLKTGEYSIADIRGSYTFAEIEKYFGVPADLLFQTFLVPEKRRSETFKIKTMHEDFFEPVVLNGTEIEVGTDIVRVMTSLYTGLPYTSDETFHLPVSAVNLLIQEQKLQGEEKTYWETHTFDLVLVGEAPVVEESPAESPEAHETVDIKGKTTMGELLKYGLTKEQFQEITGIEMPDNSTLKLRNFVTENGLEMETVKTKILEVLAPAPAEETSPAEEPQDISSPTAHTEEQPTSAEETETSVEIKGSTTIGALLDYGLTKERFKEITGIAIPDDNAMKLKDFADANGLEMETLKDQITEAFQQ